MSGKNLKNRFDDGTGNVLEGRFDDGDISKKDSQEISKATENMEYSDAVQKLKTELADEKDKFVTQEKNKLENISFQKSANSAKLKEVKSLLSLDGCKPLKVKSNVVLNDWSSHMDVLLGSLKIIGNLSNAQLSLLATNLSLPKDELIWLSRICSSCIWTDFDWDALNAIGKLQSLSGKLYETKVGTHHSNWWTWVDRRADIATFDTLLTLVESVATSEQENRDKIIEYADDDKITIGTDGNIIVDGQEVIIIEDKVEILKRDPWDIFNEQFDLDVSICGCSAATDNFTETDNWYQFKVNKAGVWDVVISVDWTGNVTATDNKVPSGSLFDVTTVSLWEPLGDAYELVSEKDDKKQKLSLKMKEEIEVPNTAFNFVGDVPSLLVDSETYTLSFLPKISSINGKWTLVAKTTDGREIVQLPVIMGGLPGDFSYETDVIALENQKVNLAEDVQNRINTTRTEYSEANQWYSDLGFGEEFYKKGWELAAIAEANAKNFAKTHNYIPSEDNYTVVSTPNWVTVSNANEWVSRICINKYDMTANGVSFINSKNDKNEDEEKMLAENDIMYNEFINSVHDKVDQDIDILYYLQQSTKVSWLPAWFDLVLSEKSKLNFMKTSKKWDFKGDEIISPDPRYSRYEGDGRIIEQSVENSSGNSFGKLIFLVKPDGEIKHINTIPVWEKWIKRVNRRSRKRKLIIPRGWVKFSVVYDADDFCTRDIVRGNPWEPLDNNRNENYASNTRTHVKRDTYVPTLAFVSTKDDELF